MNKNVTIKQIQVKDVMTKSNGPLGGIALTLMLGAPMAANIVMPHL